MSVPLIQSPALLEVPGLRHGLTTRTGGVSPAPFDALNLGLSTEDAAARVHINRTRVSESLGLSEVRFLKQVHGARIVCASEAQSSPCLLYTSPSPRDKRQSRMPSSA